MNQTLPLGVARWKRMRGQKVSISPPSNRIAAAARCSLFGFVCTQYQRGWEGSSMSCREMRQRNIAVKRRDLPVAGAIDPRGRASRHSFLKRLPALSRSDLFSGGALEGEGSTFSFGLRNSDFS